MSKEALAKVVQRAISDGAFRRQLATDPTGALRGYDLSSDEQSAIRSGDAGRLSSLGVDQRMSKAFTLGGDAAVTRLAPSDISSSVTSVASGGDSAMNAVQKFELGGAGAASNGLATGGSASSDALIGGDAGHLNAVQKFELGNDAAAGNAIATGGADQVDTLVGDGSHLNAVQKFELGNDATSPNALEDPSTDPTRIIGDDAASGGGGQRAF